MNLRSIVLGASEGTTEKTLADHYKPTRPQKSAFGLWGNGAPDSETGYEYSDALTGKGRTYHDKAEAEANNGITHKQAETVRKHIHSAIKPTPTAFTTYRGLSSSDRSAHVVGKTYKTRHLMSSSLDQKVAEDFARDHKRAHPQIMHLSVPKGHSGVYLGKHATPHEKEFLHAPRTRYLVHKIEDKDGIRHIHAKVLPPQPTGE